MTTLQELVEYIEAIEIPILHTSTQETHAHTIKRQILSKAKQIQKEEPKTYTQEEMDEAKNVFFNDGYRVAYEKYVSKGVNNLTDPPKTF